MWASPGTLSVGIWCICWYLMRCIIMRLCLVPHDSPSLVSRLIFCFPDLKFLLLLWLSKASLVVQTIKNLPTMQETLVWPWVGKIPWSRKGQPSIFAWRIVWTEEPGGPWGFRIRHDWATNTALHYGYLVVLITSVMSNSVQSFGQ